MMGSLAKTGSTGGRSGLERKRIHFSTSQNGVACRMFTLMRKSRVREIRTLSASGWYVDVLSLHKGKRDEGRTPEYRH